MSSSVSLSHNFETGHRLPHVPGKCRSLHGHSWNATVIITAPGPNADGMVVEFGAFKLLLRQWIDTHLDHGLMLGRDDQLLPALVEAGKVFVFTEYDGLWPTVENVAQLIGRISQGLLESVPHVHRAIVTAVEVRETAVNAAVWMPDVEDLAQVTP